MQDRLKVQSGTGNIMAGDSRNNFDLRSNLCAPLRSLFELDGIAQDKRPCAGETSDEQRRSSEFYKRRDLVEITIH